MKGIYDKHITHCITKIIKTIVISVINSLQNLNAIFNNEQCHNLNLTCGLTHTNKDHQKVYKLIV